MPFPASRYITVTVPSCDIAGAYGTSKKLVERLRGIDQEALSLLLVFNVVKL